MKIALDENISPKLVRLVQCLSDHQLIGDHEVVSARSFRPINERGDAGWIERFSESGGKVIISGDARIRANLHERAALAQAGLITFFFGGKWSGKNAIVKGAMFLNWWPRIEDYITKSKAGDCWEIPDHWNWRDFRDVSVKQLPKKSRPNKPIKS